MTAIASLGCVDPVPTPVDPVVPTPVDPVVPTPVAPELKLPLAPDFELIEATSGDVISIRDYRGKVILLDFFATWCGGCIKAIDDDLVPLYEQYGDQIIILSVDIRDPDITAKDLQNFAEEHDMGWPILMGSSSNVAESYKIQVLPTIYIIDEDGVIKYFHLGSPGLEILKSEIDSLL